MLLVSSTSQGGILWHRQHVCGQCYCDQPVTHVPDCSCDCHCPPPVEVCEDVCADECTDGAISGGGGGGGGGGGAPSGVGGGGGFGGGLVSGFAALGMIPLLVSLNNSSRRDYPVMNVPGLPDNLDSPNSPSGPGHPEYPYCPDHPEKPKHPGDGQVPEPSTIFMMFLVLFVGVYNRRLFV